MNRIYGLDILRSVAILLVIYSHSYIHFGYDASHWPSFGDGVSLFFVLSGYLIGRILFKTIEKEFGFTDLVGFWFRRWMRTLPVYFFIITILMYRINHFQLEYYTFTQTFFHKGELYFFAESWSLCVEECFYLLVPLSMFLFLKFSPKKYLIFWMGLLFAVATIYKIIISNSITDAHTWDLVVRKKIFTRLDSIIYGVIAAYISIYSIDLWQKLKRFFPVGIFLWCSIFLIYDLFGFTWFTKWVSLPLESISCFLLIPYLSSVKTGQGVFYRFFTFISLISYSMYLLNFTPVDLILEIDTIQLWHTHFPELNLIIYLTVSFGGAYLLYRFIEKPFMDLRDGFILNKVHLKYSIKTSKSLK